MLFRWFKNRMSSRGGEGASLRSSSAVINGKNGLRLSASELRIGMYVAKLDRPWLSTPFKLQGFWIRSQEDIDEIRKHCDYVIVEGTENSKLKSDRRKSGLKINEGIDRSPHRLPDKEHWYKENIVHKRVSSLTFELLEDVALGGPSISKSAKKIVASCVQRVLDNPQIMILVSQMAKKGKSLESHAMSCCVLASAYGRYLGLKDAQLSKLALSALLHDVGMLKLDNVQKGMITNEDKESFKEHVVLGRNLLMANKDLWPAVDVAYCHHERIDGNGYPRGLHGEKIPYFARIVSIVEAYDDMVSNHTYKETIISPTEAMAELYRHRGTQFDRGLVESFIRFIGVYPLGSLIQLVTGEIGIVVERNPFYKRMPKVVLVLDKNGKETRSGIIDLYQKQKEGTCDQYVIRRTLPNGSHNVFTEKYMEEGIIELADNQEQE